MDRPPENPKHWRDEGERHRRQYDDAKRRQQLVKGKHWKIFPQPSSRLAICGITHKCRLLIARP